LKIFGFLQVRNEVNTGHLERFLRWNAELFDHLFAIDDASSDGTVEVLENYGATVLRNSHSQFRDENNNKQRLLELIQVHGEEGDAILWLDSDEVLYASRSELEELIKTSFSAGFDSISLNHLNLWRSESFYRLDDSFNSLQPVRIWQLSEKLRFLTDGGLHSLTHPLGLKSTLHSLDFPVVHFGFASLELILDKYGAYFLKWQTGYALERLVSESQLTLAWIGHYKGRLGARFELPDKETQPVKIPPYQWQLMARRVRNTLLENQDVKVTIVCLIFKSDIWLEFAYGQLLQLAREFDRGEVELLFVANDATSEVLDFLEKNHIPHKVFAGRKTPDEWYINSVYRAYNFGVQQAKGELVYLVNSDMAFSPSSLRNLVHSHNRMQMTVSRLVERGILESGEHGVERDFGSSPKNYRQKDFHRYAKKIESREVLDGGLFMPSIFSREEFLSMGGFPEGNLQPASLDTYLEGGSPDFARAGEPSVPGDRAFVQKWILSGGAHKTVFGSIVYHFQEGELRSKSAKPVSSGVLISNDLITGVNGEQTLWNRLVAMWAIDLPSQVVHLEGFSLKSVWSRVWAPLVLFSRLKKSIHKYRPRLIFRNGTFSLPLRTKIRTVSLIQDRPVSLVWRIFQMLSTLSSSAIFTNDLALVEARQKKGVRWVELAPNTISLAREELHHPNKKFHGLFIGAFNETKGFNLVSACIEANPELRWTLVTKYQETLPQNLRQVAGLTVRAAIPQNQVFQELKSADFLISASPHETQHLASLESVWLNTPVFITNTGFLGHGASGWQQYGFVSTRESFLSDFRLFLQDQQNKLTPRQWIEEKWSPSENDLESAIAEELEMSFMVTSENGTVLVFFRRLRSYLLNQGRFVVRRMIVPALMKHLVRFRRMKGTN
jgi:hypothetical protein